MLLQLPNIVNKSRYEHHLLLDILYLVVTNPVHCHLMYFGRYICIIKEPNQSYFTKTIFLLLRNMCDEYKIVLTHSKFS